MTAGAASANSKYRLFVEIGDMDALVDMQFSVGILKSIDLKKFEIRSIVNPLSVGWYGYFVFPAWKICIAEEAV